MHGRTASAAFDANDPFSDIKKAAKEAAVAAGLAAVGTVLEELRPGEKNQGGRATKAHDEEAR